MRGWSNLQPVDNFPHPDYTEIMSFLITNRQAHFDYDIKETFDAGIALTGHETKSVKMGRCNITGARAIIRGNEIYLVGMDIPSFQQNNAPQGYDPLRIRKLLLKKSEIKYLTGKLNEGLTIIPLKVYTAHSFIKISLGLGKHRKAKDKREYLKNKTIDRETRNR